MLRTRDSGTRCRLKSALLGFYDDYCLQSSLWRPKVSFISMCLSSLSALLRPNPDSPACNLFLTCQIEVTTSSPTISSIRLPWTTQNSFRDDACSLRLLTSFECVLLCAVGQRTKLGSGVAFLLSFLTITGLSWQGERRIQIREL